VTSVWRQLLTTRSLLALGVGVLAFLALSLVRIRLQYGLHPVAPLGFLFTLLMYLVPGAIVGLLVPQFRLVHGVLLGVITAVVVWFEVPLPHAALSWRDIAQLASLAVLFGVVVSVAGSVAAHWVIQRVTSNNRWRGP